MKIDFDPNDKHKPVLPDWATYIPEGRKPAFKMHNNRGHALNAIGECQDAILYKFDHSNHLWNEVLRFEDFKKPDNCDDCGGTLLFNLYGDGEKLYNRGDRVWINLNEETPVIAVLCQDCRRWHRQPTWARQVAAQDEAKLRAECNGS